MSIFFLATCNSQLATRNSSTLFPGKMATTVPAWWRRANRHAIDLLFPARCLSCGADLSSRMGTADELLDGPDFCAACTSELERARKSQLAGSVCRRCAAPIPALPGIECPHCSRKKLWFDRAVALGPYEKRLRHLVLRMKRDRTETIALALGKLLCRHLDGFREADWCQGTDSAPPMPELIPPMPELANLVLPVPMRPWRQMTRGTDGPAVLARVIGSHFGLPVLFGALSICRNLSPQKGLSRSSRFRNMRGGMVLRAGYPIEAARVLLVDDVLTTGATCSEAARVLKLAGANHVTVVVVARTAG